LPIQAAQKTVRGGASVLITILQFVAVSIIIYFAIALGLTLSQSPRFVPAENEEGFDFERMMGEDLSDLRPLQAFTARDGTALAYRVYDSAPPSDRVIILVHGSAWHGMQFHAMARWLSEHGLGTVILPDMRGHGFTPVRRGDVDHIGQMEEDVADLIDHVTHGMPKASVVLGGHSSGGGFVVRFAGGGYGSKADAFILLAPFLKHNAPTTRRDAGGWARPAIRRIIGLSMLNSAHVTALNGLPVIGFAMPRRVMEGRLGHTATTLYSYRLNASFAPRPDYGKDLAAIDRPLLVVAGTKDEAFRAELYEPEISKYTATGTYRVLPGVTHIGVVNDPAAFEAIRAWMQALPDA
jgi:alpha-beta hydrolase superfamily lysophospholipase